MAGTWGEISLIASMDCFRAEITCVSLKLNIEYERARLFSVILSYPPLQSILDLQRGAAGKGFDTAAKMWNQQHGDVHPGCLDLPLTS